MKDKSVSVNLGRQKVQFLRHWKQEGADVAQAGENAEICLKVGGEKFLL